MLEGLLGVAALILLSKVLEEAVIRLGFPPILGWALAGAALGYWMGARSPELWFIASIGIYLFFFLVGVEEVDVESILSSLNVRHLAAAAASTAITALGAYVAGRAAGLGEADSASLAVLAALPTSSVVARTLSDMGLLRSEVGVAAFSYTLICETMGLLLAGALLELDEQLSPAAIAVQLGVMLAFLVAAALSSLAVPRLVRAAGFYMRSREAQAGMVFGLLLLFVGAGEAVGIHGVIAALILGLALSETLLEEPTRPVLDALRRLGEGIFIPLAFASVGLRVGRAAPFPPEVALLALTLLAPYRAAIHYVLLKVVKVRHASAISSSMLARGAVDLAVLAALAEQDLISPSLYTPAMAASLAFLAIYPLLAKSLLGGLSPSEHEAPPFVPRIAYYLLGLVKVEEAMEPAPTITPAAEDPLGVLGGAEVSLVVDEEGKLLGLVERSELERGRALNEALKKPRLVARPGDKLHRVLEKMALLNQRAVPVVDEEGRPLGLLTLDSLLRMLTRTRMQQRRLTRRGAQTT